MMALENASGKDDDFDDEGLPLLPRHTKVRVTGNNRTKGSLVGLTGIVKKAVGLGGWHWLKLSNGQRCRLQRNALCVVSRPTGDEVDSEEDEEDAPVSNAPRVSTGNASNGKPNGMTRPGGPGGGGGAEGRSTIKRPSRAAASRDGPMVTGKRSERQRSGTVGPAGTVVNFDKLRTETLHKYRKHYKLDAVNDDSTTRHKLVGAIASHFVKEKVDESKVLMAFMAALSSGSTVVGGSSEDNGGGAVMTGSD